MQGQSVLRRFGGRVGVAGGAGRRTPAAALVGQRGAPPIAVDVELEDGGAVHQPDPPPPGSWHGRGRSGPTGQSEICVGIETTELGCSARAASRWQVILCQSENGNGNQRVVRAASAATSLDRTPPVDQAD